jgi:hypothetical protein
MLVKLANKTFTTKTTIQIKKLMHCESNGYLNVYLLRYEMRRARERERERKIKIE